MREAWQELLDAVVGYDALHFHYCEPHDADEEEEEEEEEEAIAELSGELHDWGDIIGEPGGAERVRVASRMSELLQRLRKHGMLAWWGHVTRQWRTSAGPMPYRLTVIEVRRMAQDQELIAARLQDIHDELRWRGWSTERAEALRGTTQISTPRVTGQVTPITRSGRANGHSVPQPTPGSVWPGKRMPQEHHG